MTVEELKGLAERQPHLYLTIPRKALPRGQRMRMCGRTGPFGRICTVSKQEDGQYAVVAVFKSSEILKFLSEA